MGRHSHSQYAFARSLPQVKPESFLDIFSSCPKLESLSLYVPISSSAFLASIRDRVASSRKGGPSLLRSLSISADGGYGDWESGVCAGPLGQLGTVFPELESLTCANLMTAGEGGAVQLMIIFGSAPLKPWAPLPRLQEVVIKGFGTSYATR